MSGRSEIKPCFPCGTFTGWSHTSDLKLSTLVATLTDHLVGLVIKASALRVARLEFDSCLHQDFSRSSHTSELDIGTPVATLPDAWRYRVSAGTGWPGVSIL